ncbi:hypothetical protein ACFW7O_31440, partial [Streptomyces diastatochromogenes]
GEVAAYGAGFAIFHLFFFWPVQDGWGGHPPPPQPVVPSLVQLADPSLTVTPSTAGLLRRRGFEVTAVPGTGHCIHRDDLEGFMASLKGWV